MSSRYEFGLRNAERLVIKRGESIKRDIPIGIKKAAVNLRNTVRLEIAAHAQNRTGALERSWVYEQKSYVEYWISSQSPYAAIRDRGGTIKARNAQFLTIPLLKSARGKTTRDYPDGFFVRRGGVPTSFGVRVGKSGYRAIFALKRSVYQRGWAYVEKARTRWFSRIESLLSKEG